MYKYIYEREDRGMKALCFKLSGTTAFFKKPDVNQYAYFTYNNIHKPALLGLLGATIGLGGYTQLHNHNQDKKPKDSDFDTGYPEFYEKLKNLKLSIVPLSKNGYFSKKIQVFNNSIGYASKEAGGNLIVREQWLEKPSWDIYILEDKSQEYQKIKKYLLESKSVFIPYLGKNDHPATISEVKEIELSEPKGLFIDSLFIKNSESIEGFEKEGESPYLFQEVSPMRLQSEHHFYEFETLIFTNMEVDSLAKDTYSYNNANYSFI